MHPETKKKKKSTSQYNLVLVRLSLENISNDVKVKSDTVDDSIRLLGWVSRSNLNVTTYEHRSHRLMK